jgi:gliding motility-associated-like protein
MNRFFASILVCIIFQSSGISQTLADLSSSYDYTKFNGYYESAKKSDSISSKMSFFGLSLINELEVLVQNELNKTTLYSVNQKNDQSQFFASVLKSIQIPDSLKRKYVLKDIGPTTYVGMFIMVSDLNAKFILIQLGAKVSFTKSNIITAYVPIDQIKNVLLIPGIKFVETAIPVKQNLDQARKFTNVNQVNSGIQLPKGYTGKNVLIGIIDGGFDYGHPAFYDSLGNYRVYSIWDQNNSAGISPSSFNYGSEETSKENILAIETDDSNGSHGTHVTGITSGANWSTTQNYKGVAYNSKLVMVSYQRNRQGDIFFNNLDIMDGIDYIYEKGQELGLPTVVNMSLGSHIGPHDGTSLFDRTCDLLLENGNNKNFSIVGSAGNEGAELLHINKQFTKSDTSVYSFVNFNSKPQGFLDIWANDSNNLSVRVGVFNIRLNKFEFISQKLSTLDNLNSHIVKGLSGENLFTIFTNSKEPENSKGHIFIYIDAMKLASSDYRVVVNFIGNDVGFHAWGFGGSNVFFDDANLFYSDLIKGNSDFSVSEIGGTGNSIITVGAYNSTADTIIGAKAYFSSKGPTVDGRIKPDISAPGNWIASSVNSYDPSFNVGGRESGKVVKTYNYLGRQYNYALMQGTSMSSPVVAGIVALWKEACPLISTNQIKSVLANTSIKDQFTGSIMNNNWGHGKIDAYAGLKYILTQMPTKPKLSISGDTIICSGKNLTLSAPLGYKSYLWNTGDTTRTITVRDEDSYVVNVQNSLGWWSDYSDTLNVYVDSINAKISRFKPDNCLNSLYLNSNLESGQSITWYKNDSIIAGANTMQFIPQESGVYKIKILNNDSKCFDVSDTLIVDMSQYSNRLFKSDSIITCSTDSIELDAGAGFKTYTWNTGATTQKIKVGKSGMYSVRVNCGEDIVNFGYLNFPANSPNSTRSYLRIPDANQIDFKDEMSILMNLNIGAVTGRPTILNKGSDASYQIYLNWPMLTFSYPGMDKKEGVSVQVPQYTWFSIGVVKTKDSVYLYYNGVIVDRAPAKTPIPVNNLPLIVGKRAGVDYDYFVGGIDQLSLWNRSLKQEEVKFFTNCSNGTNQGCVGFYNFDPSENDQSIYKNNATFYSSSSGGFLGLYGLNPFAICSGSRSVSDSIYIKIEPLPTGKIAFSFDGRCLDIPIQFKNSSDSSKTVPLQWKWEMGDGSIYNQSSVLHTYKKTGTFNVKLSMFSPYCAKFKDSLVKQIIVSPPTKPERYKSLNARKDTELPVQARNFGSAYKWRPGNLVVDSLSKNTRAKINKETDFKIYITDSAGCSTVDSQLVRVFDKYSVFVPKAFSPDGNGVNDLLRPILVGIKEVRSFRIYSRWGNLLYQTKDVSLGWDGTYNGQLMPTDTYTWVFEGIDLDNMPVILSGKTTLIR